MFGFGKKNKKNTQNNDAVIVTTKSGENVSMSVDDLMAMIDKKNEYTEATVIDIYSIVGMGLTADLDKMVRFFHDRHSGVPESDIRFIVKQAMALSNENPLLALALPFVKLTHGCQEAQILAQNYAEYFKDVTTDDIIEHCWLTVKDSKVMPRAMAKDTYFANIPSVPYEGFDHNPGAQMYMIAIAYLEDRMIKDPKGTKACFADATSPLYKIYDRIAVNMGQ